MSEAGVCANFLTGVVVVNRAEGTLAMAARMLGDLGATVRSPDGDDGDADVVLACTTRPEGSARHAVWVTVTPFGATGPRSHWRASDLGVLAASGNLWATGDPDRPPVRCAGEAAYAHTAPEVAFAALTGLASGRRPLDVDVSMQEVTLVANMGAVGRAFTTGNRGQRVGANIGRTREIWPCADGWVSFGLRGGKARIASLETLARLIGDPLLTERDWTTFDHTKASDEELNALEKVVGAWFRTRSVAELYEHACATNLMLAPINSPKELYASAQLAARGFFDSDGVPTNWCHVRSGRATAEPAPSTPASAGWSGTRILEFGAGAAGPIATRYFAEHGATVLRVESASRPDFLRTGTYGPMFNALNVGKRSVTLNLKHPEGHTLARRLVAEWADAVTENFAPKAMRGLGLAYDDLVADRADLVMVSACLNGQTGPHRDYPGFGGQGSALAGFNYLTGWPDREPIGPFGTITDSLAPRFVAAALGGALLHRRRTGAGSYVDISQVECATWTLSDWLLAFRRLGIVGERCGNDHPGALLHGLYRCAGDDRWVAVACWTADELEALSAAIKPDDDLETWTSRRAALEVAEVLQHVGVEAVPVQDFVDAHDDPQLEHRHHLVELDHPEAGIEHYERNGFRLGDLEQGYDRAAPVLGQDTDWVLGEVLGLSSVDQARLHDDGALS